MDAALRKQITGIGRDRSAGASELTARACAAVEERLRRARNLDKRELCEIAAALLRAQPAMAPFVRLANELASAASQNLSSRALGARLRSFAAIARNGNHQIAREFRRALAADRKKKAIVTYSRSATVLSAIGAARAHIREVICSESQPGLEGCALAQELRKKLDDMNIVLTIDAALHLYLRDADALVLGADALEEDGFINKIGTAPLVAFAQRQNTPVWVLADTTKLLPEELSPLRARSESAQRVGNANISAPSHHSSLVIEGLFEKTKYPAKVRVLTDVGWLSRAAVAQRARAIGVSPAMDKLVNPATERD